LEAVPGEVITDQQWSITFSPEAPMLRSPTLIKNLKALRSEASKQTKDTATEKAADHAVDVVGGVFDVFDYLPSFLFDLERWLDRAIHGREAPRKYLDRIRTTHYQPQGKKALCGLLTVLIEVLEAAKWIDDVYVGSLPVAVRVADSGGIGRNDIAAVDRKSEIPAAVQKLVRTATNGQDDQSHTQPVLNGFDSLKHGVLTPDLGPVSVSTETENKECKVCRTLKPTSAFYAHKKAPDGLQYECRDCTKARVRTRRSGEVA
jgi:hypothetical protein